MKKLQLYLLIFFCAQFIFFMFPKAAVAACTGAGSVCCDYVYESFACADTGNACIPSASACNDGFDGDCVSTGTHCSGAVGGYSCSNWQLYTNSCGSPGCEPGLYEYSNSGCTSPPTGGWGCVNSTCTYTSWGTNSDNTCGGTNCVVNLCGNGALDTGEACDASVPGTTGCSADCQPITNPSCSAPNQCVLAKDDRLGYPGCPPGQTRAGNCGSGKECCYLPPPDPDCDIYKNNRLFKQGFACVPNAVVYNNQGSINASCSYQDMRDGKWRLIDDDITKKSSSTNSARNSCNDGSNNIKLDPAGYEGYSGERACGAQCDVAPLDLCLLKLNPQRQTRLDEPRRFELDMYNLPSVCGYGITEADRTACRDGLIARGESCTNSFNTTYWRLGSTLQDLAHPAGRYCTEDCTSTACTSNRGDYGGSNGRDGAASGLGWRWDDNALYSNRTAASPPVEIMCKGWIGGLDREGSVVPITRKLGKVVASVSPAKVLTGTADPDQTITFTFVMTNADQVPPGIRLHSYKTQHKAIETNADGSVKCDDGWWGTFWSRFVIWTEPNGWLASEFAKPEADRNTGGSVDFRGERYVALNQCNLRTQTDPFTWVFDCKPPIGGGADGTEYWGSCGIGGVSTPMDIFGKHSVVFTNDWNVETEVQYEVVETLPPVPAAPINLNTSCTRSDKLLAHWDAVTGADSYVVKFNDGVAGLDNLDVVSPNVDVCPGDPDWDACIETSSRFANIQVINPIEFTQGTWSVYAVNTSGNSTPTDATLKSCIPNCRDIEGPPTVTQGDTALYSAIFESAHGFLGGNLSIKGIDDPSVTGFLKWDGWESPQYARNFGDATTIIGEANRALTVFSWDTTNVPVGTYNLYCRAWNDGKAECQGDTTTTHTAPTYACKGGVSSMVVEVTAPQITISGTVYDGIGNTGVDYCTQNGTPADWAGMAQGTVRVATDITNTTSVDANTGSYTSPPFLTGAAAGTEALVSLSDIPSGYSLICPANGQYSVNINGVRTPITDVNFYISKLKDAWWQTRSGLVYGSTVTSSLPYSADDAALDPTCAANSTYCIPYLIAGAYGDTAARGYPTAGIPLSKTGVSGTQGFDTQRVNINSSPSEAFESVDLLTASMTTENYATLSRQFDLTAATTVSSPLSELPTGATMQEDAEVYTYTGGGTLTISPNTNWLIPNGKKIVIFADGPVKITGNGSERVIGVTEGGFFAIIATGDITIDENVGRDLVADPAYSNLTPQIEGVYISDGTLKVAAYSDVDLPDKRFVGAGTFVGWLAVSLPRNFETSGGTSGLLNGHVPTETFVFRPDFAVNAPILMRSSSFSWREINSLTQE